jgi:hypothetical protein
MNKCIKVYRSLYILESLANQVYSKITIPALNIMFLVGIPFLAFGLIRLRDVLDVASNGFIVIALISWPVLQIFVFDVLSSFLKYSLQFRSSLQQCLLGERMKIGKYLRLKIRSCRPIQFRVGNFYTVEQNAILTMFDCVVTWTDYLLVSL